MDTGSATAVKSADRVLDLLELLSSAGRGLSHTDIAAALDIPKSSLTQLLRNLIARGYVVTVPGGGHGLGPALSKLMQPSTRPTLAELATPILEELTRQTGESSALNELNGNVVEVTATVLGPARLVTHMRLGDVAPLYATSSGKAILANLPTSAQRDYLDHVQFEPATPATLRTVGSLKNQLATIRERGFAYSHEEWTPGIVGVGIVLLDQAAAVLGALNVAVPAVRFDDDCRKRVEGALGEAALRLLRRSSTNAA